MGINNVYGVISVITVVYNDVTNIEKTILSVLNQTYKKIQYIVIDGGSDDGTVDVINKYIDRINYFITEKDNGIYDAMNKGLLKATGDWVNFMNSGDVFASTDVLSNIFYNKTYLGVDVIYGNSIEIKNNERILKKSSSNPDLLLKYPIYRHGASFVNADIHKNNLFPLELKKIGFGLDYYIIHKLKVENKVFKKVEEIIMEYQFEGTSNHPYKAALYVFRTTFKQKPFYAFIKLLGVWTKHFFKLYK